MRATAQRQCPVSAQLRARGLPAKHFTDGGKSSEQEGLCAR